MENKIDNKILINFLKGKYSYNDYLKVKDWFNRIEKNKRIKEQMFSHWEELTEVGNSKDDSLQYIFEKIQYKILLEEKKGLKKKVIWNFYRNAAAILLIPILAFSLWFFLFPKTPQVSNNEILTTQSWVEINAPEGARVEFFLPDSTFGWLNSGSKLKYPIVFNQHRKVNLVGEAYFEVKHRELSDFIVSVADLNVKVLGTKFNVSAYSDDSFTDVVLKEGKVEIEGNTCNFNQILSSDEKLTFNHDSKSLNLNDVDAEHYTAWKDGYLIIENEPLGQVVGRIERWYNIEITIQDEILKNYRFKATFKDEPLAEVLRLLALTTPIRYSIEKRDFDSDGTLKRRKVTLKLT